MRYCVICGKPAIEHHLVFGKGLRDLSEVYGLKLDMCNEHHNMAVKPEDRVHGNNIAQHLSKMLGQMQYERDFIAREYYQATGVMPDDIRAQAKESFMDVFGRSYL